MPNWCENKLEIVGDINETLRRFLKKGLKFSNIVRPVVVGDDAQNLRIVGSQVSCWGTKWDLTDEQAVDCGEALLSEGYCFFDTAYSPPLEALTELSKQIPSADFTLHYHEPGMSFYGTARINAGECDDMCEQVAQGEHYADFLCEYFGYDEYDAEIQAGLTAQDD